ncbi:Dynactin subunit 2 [Exaiptasia diaphana]|nr:Dynactin subunit 2 [Exaiptasia diaphana]
MAVEKNIQIFKMASHPRGIFNMSDLEKRISTLEKVLGNDLAQVSSLTADLEIKEKNILGIVSAIQSKVALLDPNHVEHIDARLQGILHHVTQVSEKKDSVENAAKQSKVNELYDLISKWDCVVDVVPDVIKRLHSLRFLHEQGSEFGQTLVQLDRAQHEVTDQLKTQEKLLKEIKRLHSLRFLHEQGSEFGQTLVQLDRAQHEVTDQLKTQEKLLKEAAYTIDEKDCQLVAVLE